MHDAKGRELKVGDRVMIPAIITQTSSGEEYCNVSVDLEATMPPYSNKTTMSALNTKQVLRANEGDDLKYEVEILPDGQIRIR